MICKECDERVDDCVCHGRLINVTFGGYPGTYFQPPEPAEMVIWCPQCQADTDAESTDTPQGEDTFHATCVKGHEVNVGI